MGSYVARTELPRTVAAARAARMLVAETLTAWDWGSAQQRVDAVLLANEITSNAVEHTHGEGSLVLELVESDSRLRVSLSDESIVRPIVRELSHPSARGRGMRIVATIAQRWGVDEVHGGKRVWFQMNATTWADLPEQ